MSIFARAVDSTSIGSIVGGCLLGIIGGLAVSLIVVSGSTVNKSNVTGKNCLGIFIRRFRQNQTEFSYHLLFRRHRQLLHSCWANSLCKLHSWRHFNHFQFNQRCRLIVTDDQSGFDFRQFAGLHFRNHQLLIHKLN
jgi:hypothetical protein